MGARDHRPLPRLDARDPTAAEHPLGSVVENRDLPLRCCAHRRVERHARRRPRRPRPPPQRHRAGSAPGRGRAAAARRRRRGPRRPALPPSTPARPPLLRRDAPSPVGVDPRDERRPPERDAEPLALPDGEAMHPLVLPDDVPAASTIGPGRTRPFARSSTNSAYACAPAPTKQSSWLSPFVRAGQLARDRFGAHLGLGRLAERKDEPLEPRARSRVEEVALVLRRVGPGGEPRRSRHVVPRRARVVPGRDVRGAEPVGDREELGELHAAVARRARARRLAGEVRVDERRRRRSCAKSSRRSNV